MKQAMSRLFQFALVGLLAGGILLILICPQPRLMGSYQATHGPTVTLSSLRAVLLLVAAIAAAAGSLAGLGCFGWQSSARSRSLTLGSVLLC